jgi:predicted transposase YdaD
MVSHHAMIPSNKTDTLFYQLFQSFHTLLFELIDRPISEAEGYKFSSVEIKEKAFRLTFPQQS